jgi:YVTN family beta-propeller protein
MNKQNLKNSQPPRLSRLAITATFLFTVLLFEPRLGNAQSGVVSSTLNGQQIGLLHWYQVGTAAQFAVGKGPVALAFDGAHISVANTNGNTLSKLDASTGSTISTVATGFTPDGVAFDGASIWVSEFGANGILKIQASTGAVLGFFPTGMDRRPSPLMVPISGWPMGSPTL